MSVPGLPVPQNTRPLRVLFIIDSLSLGGAELCLIRLTQHLPPEQFQCRVLTFHSAPDADPILDAFDCPIDHWPIKTIFGASALKGAARLRRLIREEKIDIVHTFFQTSDLWAGPIAKLGGAKILISSRRDMGFLRKPQHTLAYRMLHGIFDQVQAVSEGVRQWTIQTDGTDPERILTIHNGIDTELSASAAEVFQLRETLHIAPGSLVIATVANLRPIKGIDVLVRAAALVRKEFPKALFLVAGDYSHPSRRPYFDEVMELMKSLDVEHTIRFTGQLKRVPSLLALSDAFVLPSRSEGLSNALLEAMLAGLPCVATTVGGNPEVVVDGETGYLVPPEDPHALAQSILELLRDPALRAKMSRASRDRALAKFTTARMTRKVAGAYRLALWQKGFPEAGVSTSGEGISERRSVLGWGVSVGASFSGKVASAAGLNVLLRRSMLRDRFLALCYHGVLREPPANESAYTINVLSEEFSAQLDFLQKRFHLMSASELIAIADGRQEFVPGSAIITFDDGYLNNVTVAAPMLRARGIPAIFNLSTAHIGQDTLLWPDEVFLRLMHWPDSVIPLPGDKACLLPQRADQRASVAVELQERCKVMENDLRIAYLEQLRSGSSLPKDVHLAEVYRFMSWDDARELSAQGFEIGSHTVNHPILSRVGAEQVKHELRTSKERIERELGRECRVIAYPNGLPRDVDAVVVDAAASANYRLGFLLQRGLGSPQHRMSIDRINVPGGEKKAVFESRAAGIYVVGQHLIQR